MTVGSSIKCLTQNRISFCLCRETNGFHIERYRLIHSFHWHVQNATIPSVLRRFCHSSLLCTFSCYPSPPTILPSSLNSSCHLFLGLPLNLVVPKFIYNTVLGILFSSILCTCRHQRNLIDLIVSVLVGF